jgi:MFS family permease
MLRRAWRLLWQGSNALYRQWVLGLVLFALCNSSDAFLILRMRDAGLSDTQTIGMYVWYNVVYAAGAYPIGIVADRVGVKRVYRVGILLFVAVYASMAQCWTLPQYVLIMAVYGLYAAATDGVAKALLVQTVPSSEVATAMGTYTSFQSLATLLSSLLTGLLWYALGPTTTFVILASVALVAWLYMSRLRGV